MRTQFLLAAVLVSVAAASAQEPPSAERPVTVSPTHDTDYTPSLEYATPHVAWAKPYAQGPVHALICAWAAAGRTVVELHQRMDLTFDYVSAGPNNVLWRAHPLKQVQDDEVARVKALLKKPHDVIVLGAVPWTWYPEDVRAEILRQVERGTGLVFSHSDMPTAQDGPLFETYRKATPPGGDDYFPSDRARATTHGAGRVAFEHLTEPAVNDDHLRYFSGMEERGVEQLVRTILWAAKKEPKVRILPADLSKRPAQGTLHLEVYRDLAAQYPMLYGRMPFQFRPYASWEHIPFGIVAPHRDPDLPGGRYLFNYTLRDPAGRVVSWRNTEVGVGPRSAVAEIRVGREAGDLRRADEVPPAISFGADDTAHVAVVVSTPPAHARVRLTLFDREGRMLGEDTRPVVAPDDAQGASFALPLHRALHRLVIARAELLGDAGVLAENRAPIVVRERPGRAPAFRVCLYGASLLRPDLTTSDISYRKGYRVSTEDAALQHAWHDAALGEFSGVVATAKGVSDEFVRDPSFEDPAFRERQKQWVRDFLTPVAGVGFNLLLCDEWTHAFCPEHKLDWPKAANQDQSEFARRAFREYLKAEYGTLEALNATWQSDYKAWDEIRPPIYDNDPAKCPDEKRWPHIISHRAFVEKSVADFIAEIAQTAKAISPALEVGSSGHYTLGMWTGCDYYLWAKHAPHIVTYRDLFLWQSFTPQRVAAWIGYGAELRDPAKENYRAWKDLLEGVEKAYWGREMPPFRPDFTLLPAPAQYFAVKRETRDKGIADLLMGARGADRIAILYHPRSFILSSLKDWRANGADYVARLSRVNGYGGYLGAYWERFTPGSYHWVHADQVRTGDFGQYAKPTVVVLPQTEALSDEEAAVLRRYVEEGGILVADLNPGVRDAHGRPRAKGALDDVFGIASADGKTTGGPKENAFGRGRAVFLARLPQDPDDFDRVRRLAGVQPEWRVEAGNPPAMMGIREFRRGAHVYLLCTANNRLDAAALEKARDVIVLPRPMHVYDVRRGAYLGETDRIEARFRAPADMGAVFACLPYRVAGVEVAAQGPQVKPGDTLAYQASLALPAPHATAVHTLRVQVFGPDGGERRVYADRIPTTDGVARGEIPLALNDAPGRWRIVVADVASGVSTEGFFEMKDLE